MPAPFELKLPRRAPARVLGFGAYLKNTACLLDGDSARLSALHGDLGTPEACAALDTSIRAWTAQTGARIDAVAHDLHPDFHSSRAAAALAQRLEVPAIAVQHHHAHIAAVQAEHGLRGPLIGLALDGVGLGTDGVAWGGELLWGDAARWSRLGHLTPIRLAGGDVAARAP
jgi:hydrogenase maturation protein HypF